MSYSDSYNYDQYGNMSCVVGGSGYCPQVSYYASSNHINQIGSASASYDAAGNLTGDGGSYSYQYDAEGRLASINGGSVATLGYNALGQQVQMSTASYTWSVLFDPTGGWVGRNTSGNWEVGGVFHLGQRQFGMYLDQFYGIHVNALGSTATDTNAAGSEAGAFLFYPWGQTWSSGSGPWQFSAFEYGDPPYLFPTLFRTYYPEFGRWLTPDSTGGDVTNPQSLNRYAYALTNPTSLTDPLGLQQCKPGQACPPPHPPA